MAYAWPNHKFSGIKWRYEAQDSALHLCFAVPLGLLAAVSGTAIAQQKPDAAAQLRQEMGQEAMKFIASRL
jgi:hypothetical protein